MRRELLPSHLASSSCEIGSSFGGSSWTGTLGSKRLGSGSCSTIVRVGEVVCCYGEEVGGRKRVWGGETGRCQDGLAGLESTWY